MKKLMILTTVLLLAVGARAQVECKRTFFGSGPFYDSPTTALKWSPIASQGFNAKAFTLEQRIGDRYSISISLLSHDGYKLETNVAYANIKAHQAVEINHRLYPVAPMEHGYIQVGTGMDFESQFSYNFGLGVQEYLFQRIPVDFTITLQSSNETMQYDSRFFLRAGLAVGFSM